MVTPNPSGITTWSHAGARFGYGQLGRTLLMLPRVIAAQEACGRVGNILGEERR